MMPCTCGPSLTAPWNWGCTSQTSPTSCTRALPWTPKLPPGKPHALATSCHASTLAGLRLCPVSLCDLRHDCWTLPELRADDG